MTDRPEPRISEALARIAKERGWPPEIARRVAEMRVPIAELNSWGWTGLSPEQTAAQLKWYERLTSGDLRGREAAYTDNEAFSDLWADSPEEIGEWEITVERGPDAFAQFKLQENVHLPVLALGHQLIACCGFSRRNVLIAGRRVSVVYGQALRVRRSGATDGIRRPGTAAGRRARDRATGDRPIRHHARAELRGRELVAEIRSRCFGECSRSARAPCPVSRFQSRNSRCKSSPSMTRRFGPRGARTSRFALS